MGGFLDRLRRRADAPAIDLSALEPADAAIVERCLPHTMTGVARLTALIDAVRYCVERGIEGDLAECGVWRGGSVLAMILTLQELGADDREIHLYDTFEGMTRPSEADTTRYGPPALEGWDDTEARMTSEFEAAVFDPSAFGEQQVRELLAGTGYPEERLHFVAGSIEETLPGHVPERLALLRLDTDWYESTRHELLHLYPRLAVGGVLIVDDYGHWDGCRRAVDEYFAGTPSAPLLARIDYSGRIAVKR